ncbi:hypothetical protein M409DRAFT_22967 [Zasmidium cellare ATCC 36951]|uniref:Uncharacterized protein n=1 Tax=Zasmidium cellare ATCC 36951 TaxID=1080233 RepID=A0A6A6CIE0_ZASCE|nr:uncharacterized protein M409DRAFT_22967 [Zasmidium cellare ATCC 36951]KAF2166915.1 hypothetical protein M409DRAFT_22967 [Zasmidium cellare ATCC 36951]
MIGARQYTCTLYNWDSTNVAARIFDKNAHDDKEQFARAYITSSDYLVADVMGDVKNHVWHTDFTMLSFVLIAALSAIGAQANPLQTRDSTTAINAGSGTCAAPN